MIHQPTVRSSSIKIAADTCANAIFHPFMDHLLAKVSRQFKKKKERESLLNYRIIVVQYMLDLKQIFNSLESMSGVFSIFWNNFNSYQNHRCIFFSIFSYLKIKGHGRLDPVNKETFETLCTIVPRYRFETAENELHGNFIIITTTSFEFYRDRYHNLQNLFKQLSIYFSRIYLFSYPYIYRSLALFPPCTSTNLFYFKKLQNASCHQ